MDWLCRFGLITDYATLDWWTDYAALDWLRIMSLWTDYWLCRFGLITDYAALDWWTDYVGSGLVMSVQVSSLFSKLSKQPIT